MKKYHYTYRITNKVEKKHYYGTRSSKLEPKLDLGVKYFSSSTDKEFMKDQKENHQNYKYKIIKIFTTREDAINLEIKLHYKFDVGINESFYNKTKQKSIGFDTTGRKLTEEHKLKIKEYAKHITQETRDKISAAGKGRKHSDETKLKMSMAAIGKPKSEEAKENMRKYKRTEEHAAKLKESKQGENNPMFGRKQKRVICPHCNKDISINLANKYHFDNCKTAIPKNGLLR